MKVSFFQSVKNTSPKLSKDVSFFLDRIKDGKSKELVEQIRQSEDKEEQRVLKNQLPVVCFNGYFSNRSKAGLKKASGLMILDFDDFSGMDEAKEFKEKLKKDVHVFAAWLSPRNGVKALYRIPIVQDDNQFKGIYNSVETVYPNLDSSGKDISRACYESFDPNIYVNLTAEIYYPSVQVVDIEPLDIGEVTNIPLKDQDIIANRLLSWFQKHYDKSNRNSSLFKLAAAFNDFGVAKHTAMVYCSRYAENGFPVSEITGLINSAYKHTSQFGTKHFEDRQRKKKLTAMVLSGKKEREIQKEFADIEVENLTNEVNIIRENTKINEFWEYTFEGKLRINSFKMKLYLHSLNYYKHYPVGNDKTFVFISKVDNFLEVVNEYKIKDHVIRNLEAANEIDVFNVCAGQTKLFTTPYLSMIDTADVDFMRDDKDFAMIYYQNNAVKVFENTYEIFDYEELDFHIWKDQVIKRDFIIQDHHESMFRTFLWLISGQEVERYNTMKSVIGYLLHSYKTSANNKAIILNDEVISDNPNGGSGKGLLTNAISHMKKVSTIDGKVFDFNKSFPYQTVSTDCQVLAFDDVRKNFDFEKLFSIITEGITIEYKGRDAVKLSVKDSPKVLISTNYTIKADGGSFERRMFEVELSSFFGAHHTPLDEFGCMLFDDWDSDEWARFDHFMINCLQYYLRNGLVGYEHKNLKIRKLINQTAKEFVEWMDDKKFTNGERIFYKDWFDSFVVEYEDFKKWLTNRTFNNWLKAYFEFRGFGIENGATNGKRYYEIKSDKLEDYAEDCPF
jgi:hypothetical protein